jgi:hypothetical protein
MALFPPYFADFFDRSAATACKNLLRLAKNGHFFVSDATTLTSYLVLKKPTSDGINIRTGFMR